jgi:hypothetical protein
MEPKDFVLDEKTLELAWLLPGHLVMQSVEPGKPEGRRTRRLLEEVFRSRYWISSYTPLESFQSGTNHNSNSYEVVARYRWKYL